MIEYITISIAAISAIATTFLFLSSRSQDQKYAAELDRLQTQIDINKRLMENHAYDSLQKNIMDINYELLERDADFPVLKDVQYDINDEKNVKRDVVLLLHQTNVFYLSFIYRDALGEKQIEAMKNWIRSTVRPWVEERPYLVAVVTKLCSGDDLYQDDFLPWLKDGFKRN